MLMKRPTVYDDAQPTISRRGLIAATLAAAATCAVRAPAGAVPAVSLAAAARHTGRFYGSAVRIDQVNAEPDLRDAVLRECAYVVPEIEMNWDQIEPTRGQLEFAKMDDLAAFALANGKRVRGHTLLWHLAVPDWAVSLLRETQDWSVIARYFGSVIPRYGDVISQWEVVNEPIDPGHRADGLRDDIFLAVFGPHYINRALAQARTFAPHAQLIVNDYGLEYDIPEERERRYLLLKLLERLRRENAPLDALGMQGHLDLRKGHVSAPSIAAFMRSVAGLGLSIVVTELDVKEADYVASVEERDQRAADEVRRYLDVVLGERGVLGVTTWGLSDRHSWLQLTLEDFARFPGAWSSGGGPGFNRGLPFDAAMAPKPMFYAMRDALWSVRGPKAHKRE